MADIDIKQDLSSGPGAEAYPGNEPAPGEAACHVAEDDFSVAPQHPAATTLWENLPEAPHDAELVRLRNMLFSRELVVIKKLQELLCERHHTAQDVSAVLAEAIQLRAEDPHMGMALEPVVDEIVKSLLRKRRGEFVDSLFPLMGPSIRKSIAETFRSMLESFSRSMEMAFSWRGLRWRFEAMRSGKPFSEIVMLHTLVYRVEQLFFIHSETGIALSNAVFEAEEAQDADMVSAMFTAIQDFVRDCFAKGAEGELESLQLGEFTIFIEKSPLAYLACVVRGTPPATFREQLRATLEFMLVEYHDDLTAFQGDTTPFATAEHYLGSCFSSSYVDEGKKLPLWAKLFPVILIVALAAGLGYYTHQKRQAAQTMQNALAVLRAEPGILITDIERNDTLPWDVAILKDELSADPVEVLQRKNIDPSIFSFKVVPFISYDAKTVTMRAEQTIPLPEGVTMTFDKGTLTLSGTAPMPWIVKARESARALPGIDKVDISGLSDPMADKISSLVKEVEGTVIEFSFGKDTPVASDVPKLQKAVETLIEIEKTAKDMGFVASLTVFGHADTVGSEKRNYEISQARTRTVAAMLYARGSAMPISMYGMGAEYPRDEEETKDSQASRRVELRVHVMQSAAASPDTLLFLQK